MTHTGSDYDLDYLFIAELVNGQIVKQDPTDTAKYAIGSAFSDLNQEHIKRFSLVGKGHVFTLDLKDGHLEADGNRLYPPTSILPGADLRLIYYRTVSRDLRIGPDGKPLPPKVKYVLGWQYTLRNKNYKWEMGIE